MYNKQFVKGCFLASFHNQDPLYDILQLQQL